MIFKMRTQRENRKNRLINAGFTNSEAQVLSKFKPGAVPYLKDIVTKREKEWRRAQRDGMNRVQFNSGIRKSYDDLEKQYRGGRHAFINRGAVWMNNIYKIIELEKEAYIKIHTDYRSPSDLRHKQRSKALVF